jgi:hypothetical protein
MADWRQIQARIRKAKNSPDAPSKLSELYQRTRDAMVAWELGAIEEKAGHNEEAGRWYTISAQRFRRADWKKKAEEALARLGMELPVAGAEASPQSNTVRRETSSSSEPQVLGEIHEAPEADEEDATNSEIPANETSAATPAEAAKKKRRRGRRGGRGRRRKGSTTAAPGLPSKAFAESAESPRQPSLIDARAESRVEAPYMRRERSPEFPSDDARAQTHSPAERSASSSAAPSIDRAAPMLPSERTAHGRAGDPALASRLARLESMLRRLVSSPLHSLDQAEEAPAGPGVFLLSDSDQITSYYVEACQTLRVGIGNLVRGSRGSKNPRSSRGGYPDTSGLKAKLAEHLEINEAKVSQYLKDHCVIRWIQLDDDAPLLAHFAIAVLRTPLNMD